MINYAQHWIMFEGLDNLKQLCIADIQKFGVNLKPILDNSHANGGNTETS